MFNFRFRSNFIVGLILIVSLSFFLVSCNNKETNTVSPSNNSSENSKNTLSTNLVISKAEINETAKFYPFEIDGIKMELFAVKASNGTIKTALNTCQICFDSGKGYYKQEGNELVCQNCKNRFKVDEIEKVTGGCNPVPIMKENKTEDANTIVVSKDFLAQNKSYFERWKK